MSARLGFGLSLLAACAVHAAVLLVPRIALEEEAQMPTVELTLEAELPEMGEPASGGPSAPRAAPAPIAPARTAAPGAPAVVPEEAQPGPAVPETRGEAPAEASEQAAGLSQDGPAPSILLASPAASGMPATGAASGGGDGRVSTAATQGAGTADSSPGFVPPHPRAAIRPAYPRSARRSGLEGVVKVSALIGADGAVISVEISASSGHAILDNAALDSLRHASFAPAVKNGVPIASRIIIPIRFKLAAETILY